METFAQFRILNLLRGGERLLTVRPGANGGVRIEVDGVEIDLLPREWQQVAQTVAALYPMGAN